MTHGLVVFGGTFDPPHRWHVAAARAARDRLFARGWVLFIPAARNPLKARGPAAPDADRAEMVRLAARRLARSVVWEGELHRRGPSYTVDSLRRLRRLLPGVPLRLLIGADQAVEFHRWRRFREVMRLAEPAVVLRPPIATAAALRRALRAAGAWSPAEIDEWIARLVPLPSRALASTDLRRRLARTPNPGRSPALRAAVPASVLGYIGRRGLYRRAGGPAGGSRG